MRSRRGDYCKVVRLAMLFGARYGEMAGLRWSELPVWLRESNTSPPLPHAALALDRKKLAAFSALGGGFLQFPIGDRRCKRTRASVSNAGGNARPSLTNATLAASRLLHRRCLPRLARKVHWPPTEKSWPHFRPSAGTAAPSVAPRGTWTCWGFLLSTFHVVHHSMIPLRPPHRWVIGPPLTIIGEVSSFGCSNAGGARRLSTPHTTLA